MPIYESTNLTDQLHKISGFETDYEFLTKSKMRTIEKPRKPAEFKEAFACIQGPNKKFISSSKAKKTML